jgi:hypothetical protein
VVERVFIVELVRPELSSTTSIFQISKTSSRTWKPSERGEMTHYKEPIENPSARELLASAAKSKKKIWLVMQPNS